MQLFLESWHVEEQVDSVLKISRRRCMYKLGRVRKQN